MIISMQFFPSFCVFLLSPGASQPGVFSLMAIITDELMIPELAAVTLLLGSPSAVCAQQDGCSHPGALRRHSLRAACCLTGSCGSAGWQIPSQAVLQLPLARVQVQGTRVISPSSRVPEPSAQVMPPMGEGLRQQHGLISPASCVMA